jgi:type I restriction enzyme R subunit
VELVDHLRQELRLVDFWANTHAQDVLRKWVIRHLDDHEDLVPFARQQEMADHVMGLARANHAKLVR